MLTLLLGPGPAALATLLSSYMAAIWLLPPAGLAVGSPVDRLGLAIFTGTSLLVSVLSGLAHRYRAKAAAFDREAAQREERERVELTLHQAKEEWERTFDSVPDLIAILDDRHRIVRVNEAMANVMGRAPEECVGLPCYTAIHGTDVPPAFCPHTRSLADLTEHESLMEDSLFGGNYLVSTTPLFNEAGEMYASVHVARDVTHLKRVETALRENEARLMLFVEHAPASLAMFDREMRYLQVSRRWRSDYGLGDRDLVGVSHYAIFPEIPEEWREAHRRGLAGEVLTAEADRFLRADGTVQWVRWELRPWTDGDGEIGGIVIFTEDITGRKAAEEALTSAHQQIQSVIDNTPALVYAFDLSQRFIMANTAVAELLHSTPEELIGKRRHELMPTEDAEWHEANDRMVVEAGRPLGFEEYNQLNGLSITWLTTKFPLRDAHGDIYAVAGISTDISERKQAEETIRHQMEKLEAANDELFRFNRVAVGREIRMIELKQEVNQLCQRLGEPLRYRAESAREKQP
jgi:PAS domain S-box-containing protein